jgi:hypothetical protein
MDQTKYGGLKRENTYLGFKECLFSLYRVPAIITI